jgi:hypothetical protein
MLEGEDARATAESLRAQFKIKASIYRQGPGSAQVMIEENAAHPGRKSRS